MRYLITGIKGFAGGHLLERLLQGKNKVAGIDFSSEPGQQPLPGKVKLYNADLTDILELDRIVKEFDPERIIHLAAQSSVKLSFEDPSGTLHTNIIGTSNVIQAAGGMEKPPAVLVISSCEIYGKVPSDKIPIVEDTPMVPLTPYAVSKAAVDMFCAQQYHAFKTPVYWARAFSHSGPGQKTVAVLSDWAFQAARIELGLTAPELKVGNLEVTRDYTDVRDVVDAYLAILDKGKPGTPYNVCTGKGYKLVELLDMILSFCSKKVEVLADSSRVRPVDINIMVGSPAKIKNDTGWEPKIEIEKTLQDLFDYWTDYLKPQIE